MKIIIVANGEAPMEQLIRGEMDRNTVIVAADGGGNCLYRYGILPHYLVGDFDSIDRRAFSHFSRKNVVLVHYPREKDCTDSQLALSQALVLKPREIIILGALGGTRMDHLLGALGLLDICAAKRINACLKDSNQVVRLIVQSTILRGQVSNTFSLQAYGNAVENLSLSGSKYMLHNFLLKMGDGRTIANEFLRKQVRISFTRGKLLVIQYTLRKEK